MKKDPSKLMTEGRFWSIIEDSNHGRRLKECLAPLSEDELFGYMYWWTHFATCRTGKTCGLWHTLCSADAAMTHSTISGSGISPGREVFYKALEDADSLCDVFAKLEDPEDNDYPEQEELDYAVIEVLEERTDDEDYFNVAAERYSMPLRTYDIDLSGMRTTKSLYARYARAHSTNGGATMCSEHGCILPAGIGHNGWPPACRHTRYPKPWQGKRPWRAR